MMPVIQNVTTMKAARIHTWGDLQSIQIEDVPVPELKPGEVLIQVRAAGLNRVDVGVAQGHAQKMFSLPMTLGFDVAGDVVALAEDVTDLHVGDAVYTGRAQGGFAQYAAAPAALVALKPQSLNYVMSAAIPVVGHFVWQALFTVGQLTAGEKVLIHAAAGGSGHIAVQLAKWKGAYVVGTASAANAVFVRGLGADQVIDYQATRFEDVVHDANLVVDFVGGENYHRSLDAVKPGGRIVTIAAVSPDDEKAKAHGVRVLTATGVNSNKAELVKLTDLIDACAVQPTVSHIYRLDEIRQALDAVAGGHTRGKVVIAIGMDRS